MLDARSGRIRALIRVPDTYVWTVTVGMAGSEPVVVVPGAALTAYSLLTGAVVWRYTPPGGAYVSNAVFADGVFAAEYSSPQGNGTPAASMGAVGVDAATGRVVWTAPADPATTIRGDLWDGAIADPAIPGAGGHGVALAWKTRDGQGRVDVRDLRTGVLAYSDTDRALEAHAAFLADPDLGLVAVSPPGSVRITPDGPQVDRRASGRSAAVLRSPAGSALLVGSADTYAYPTDAFSHPDDPPMSVASVFNDGALMAADLGGDVDVSTPSDYLAFRIVSAEAGHGVGAYRETVQHGIAVFWLASGPVPAAPERAAPSQAAGSPTTSLSPEPDPRGTARPLSLVRPLGREAAAAPRGYSPRLIDAYLGLRGDGSGQTIAIVDAYDDPAITADTETFAEQFGLPGVCGAGGAAGNCFDLDVVAPDGTAGADANWSLETALDVEWAHAVAPKARIRLVEAHDAGFAAMFRAVDAATAAHPAAVSMSWGMPFEFSDETFYDRHCAVAATVCSISSGDSGHPGSYPAYNPAALAVGGTNLSLADDGSVTGERAWSGSGGGHSFAEPAPAYQRDLPGGRRQIPDVAFDADPATGVAIYDSVSYRGQTGWFQVGGTSLGAPVWAAILADAYDEVTGLGSPRQGIDQALTTAEDAATGR